jgi:hypothetical protein
MVSSTEFCFREVLILKLYLFLILINHAIGNSFQQKKYLCEFCKVTNICAVTKTWDCLDEASVVCDGSSSSWDGITCSFGYITEINIEGFGVLGELPHTINNFPLLSSLILSNNSFEGKVPNISKLHSLRKLKLNSNYFDGIIPIGICDLPISELHLKDNRFLCYHHCFNLSRKYYHDDHLLPCSPELSPESGENYFF